jgi:hypothetical protein
VRPRGIVSAILALIIFQVLVSKGGSQNVSGLLGAAGTTAKKALDPTIAAIPDLSKGAASAPSSGSAPAPAPGTPMPMPTPGIAPTPSSQGSRFGLSTVPV